MRVYISKEDVEIISDLKRAAMDGRPIELMGKNYVILEIHPVLMDGSCSVDLRELKTVIIKDAPSPFSTQLSEARKFIEAGDKHSANIELDKLNKAIKELTTTNEFLLKSAEFHRAENEKVNAAEARIVETASQLLAIQDKFKGELSAILYPCPAPTLAS